MLLLLGCGEDPVSKPVDTDREPAGDTDGPGETDTETDRPDSDTEAPETDRPDTDLPPDTEVEVVLPDLGQGFVDLTAALYTTWPRDVFGGDRGAVSEPDLTHGHVVDLDGDGWPEVVLSGTGAAAGAPRDLQALRFDRLSEALVPDPALTAALVGVDPQVAAFADLDGDGDADAVPGGWTFDPIEALGGGRFDVAPDQRWPVYGPGLMSAAVADLDGDGWPDVIRNPTGCRPDTVAWQGMVRVDTFRWALRPALLTEVPSSNPYVVGVGTFGGELQVLALGLGCSSAEYSPGFFASSRQGADGYPVFDGVDPTPPGSVYKLRPVVAGGPVTRVNPMGASLGDLDGDGDADLVITSVHDDLLVFYDDGGLPLRDGTPVARATSPLRMEDGSGGPFERMKPWGVMTADIDRDGNNDILLVNGDDHSDWIREVPGDHRPMLWLRRGERLIEHDAALPDLPTNARSLAFGDLDRDGAPDLVLGGNGQLPRVYLNRVSGVRPALSVRLRGTSSGGPASGTLVRVIDDGVAADAVVLGGSMSGGGSSEPIVFTTTGLDGQVDRLELRWPSGLVQVLTGVMAGAIDVVEPETLAVSPPSRSAIADGASVLTVRHTPRGPDGGPRSATVELRAHSGQGTPTGPTVQVGDAWERSFVAPSSPGFLLVEVVEDGVILPLRPRLTWTAR